MVAAQRPGPDEYAPAFAGYVARISDTEEIGSVLSAQMDEVVRRSLSDAAEEWATVRAATVGLFRAFPPAAWPLRGTASGHPISVRALACVIVGHTRHHPETLRARYGE
jgi:hypothetical protein